MKAHLLGDEREYDVNKKDIHSIDISIYANNALKPRALIRVKAHSLFNGVEIDNPITLYVDNDDPAKLLDSIKSLIK